LHFISSLFFLFAATVTLNKTFVDYNSNGSNNITVSWASFSGPIYIDFYSDYGATLLAQKVWTSSATTGSYGFGSGGWPSPACGYPSSPLYSVRHEGALNNSG
jgi:hypothetical protein